MLYENCSGSSQGLFSCFYQVKVLFVRNLATPVTEELLEKTFSQFGKLERVKKLKDYAFVHFEDRDAAVKVSHSLYSVDQFYIIQSIYSWSTQASRTLFCFAPALPLFDL